MGDNVNGNVSYTVNDRNQYTTAEAPQSTAKGSEPSIDTRRNLGQSS